jgi:phospholipase C
MKKVGMPKRAKVGGNVGLIVSVTLQGLLLSAMALTFAARSHAQISNFQHIVMIVQENRSPDNLFQGLCGPNRSLCPSPYDLQNWGIDNQGNKIPLFATPLSNPSDPNHTYQAFQRQCDLDTSTNQCKMDGLDSVSLCKPVANNNCPFQYVIPSDVAPYITMVQQYGWANYMFQTNQGPSTPAHQVIFSGTAARTAEEDSEATFIFSLEPLGGCLTPVNAEYDLISPQTWPNGFTAKNDPVGSTCFTHDTMATLLDGHTPPLSWKYYTPGQAFFWTAPNWIRDLCQPNSTYTQCTGQEFLNNVDVNPADVLTDIDNCALRNVIWVIPTGANSDHGGFKGEGGGPSWVSSIVNAVGESPCIDSVNNQIYTYWQDTAIFILWDDWGGFYDHEPPTLLSVPSQGQGDYQYGFRVPFLAVSAYTPAGFISNNRSDFGSLLRFTEQNFGIPEGALGFADARSTTDLTEFFNMSSTPRTFTTIPAPLGKEFFLHDKRPLEAPDDD